MILTHIQRNFAASFFPRLPEWSAAMLITAIGWMLFVNDDLMVPGKQGYILMLSIADQSTWARLLVVFGIARLAVLLINGAWRRSPYLRSGAALISCLLWAQIMVSFAPTFGFAFILACGQLGLDMVNVFRASRDARIVDDAYRGASGGHQ